MTILLKNRIRRLIQKDDIFSNMKKKSDHPPLNLENKNKLFEFLSQYVSENKNNLFEQIIHNRTRYITVVLEDLFQSHNASAVLRTCDCFGIQDIHIVENTNRFEINSDVALGSSKWLTFEKYNDKEKNNTLECYTNLRKQGYTIVATTPHKNDCKLDELKLDKKIALVFGTELEGLSQTALENADEYVKIPMYGFTESFNISVSAAIFLFHLTEKLKRTNINWNLTEEEIIDIKIEWAKNVVKKSELLVNKFMNGIL